MLATLDGLPPDEDLVYRGEDGYLVRVFDEEITQMGLLGVERVAFGSSTTVPLTPEAEE